MKQTTDEKTDLVKELGESAISLWLRHGIAEAFRPLLEGAEALLACKTDSENWKSLAVIYAHLCAYLSSVAVTGRPAETSLVHELSTIPEPGLLMSYSNDLCKFYRDSLDLFILLQLLRYTEAINQDKTAINLALNIIERNKDTFNLIKAGNNLIPHLIAAGDYHQALRLSYKSSLYLFSMKVMEKLGSSHNKPESEADLRKILKDETEAFRQEIDRSSVILGLFPVFIKLAANFLLDPQKAEKQATEICSTCFEIAAESYLPELWQVAGEIIKGTFNSTYTFQELLDMGAKFSQENNYPLKHICLLGATLQKDIIPENAIVTHLIIFHELLRSFISSTFLYRQTVVPFFKAYWPGKFSNNRFRFKNPSYVWEQLEKSFLEPADKQVQKILYSIITGSNIRLDLLDRSYLDSLKTD